MTGSFFIAPLSGLSLLSWLMSFECNSLEMCGQIPCTSPSQTRAFVHSHARTHAHAEIKDFTRARPDECGFSVDMTVPILTYRSSNPSIVFVRVHCIVPVSVLTLYCVHLFCPDDVVQGGLFPHRTNDTCMVWKIVVSAVGLDFLASSFWSLFVDWLQAGSHTWNIY